MMFLRVFLKIEIDFKIWEMRKSQGLSQLEIK